MIEENLRKDLLTIFKMRIDELKEVQNKADIKLEQLSQLLEVVDSLESSLLNLKLYSREKVDTLLNKYYQRAELNNILDKLEIVRLVISLKDKGMSIDFNEEELNILVSFLDEIRALYNREKKQFDKDFGVGTNSINGEIEKLENLHNKLKQSVNGDEIIHKDEIDYLMQIAVEEEANVEIQISILTLINTINLQICKRK